MAGPATRNVMSPSATLHNATFQGVLVSLLTLLALHAPPMSLAQPTSTASERVLVGPIAGRHGDNVRTTLFEALGSHPSPALLDEHLATANLNPTRPADRQRLLQYFDAQWLFLGHVGGGKTVLQCFDRAGELAEERTLPKPSVRHRRLFEITARNMLRRARQRAPVTSEPEPTPATEVQRSERYVATSEEPNPTAPQTEPQSASLEPAPVPHAEDAGTHDTDAMTPSHFRVLSASAGVGLSFRLLSISFERFRRVLESGAYAEATAQLSLFPWARESGAVSGFHFHVEGTRSIWLRLDVVGEQDDALAIPWSVMGSLGWLVAVRETFQIGVRLGGGFEFFDIANNPWIPARQSPLLRAGLVLRVALLGEALRFQIITHGRYHLSYGELGNAFGTGAYGLGGDIKVAFAGRFDFGMTWQLSGGYARTVLKFSGDAGDLRARNGKEEAFSVGAELGASF